VHLVVANLSYVLGRGEREAWSVKSARAFAQPPHLRPRCLFLFAPRVLIPNASLPQAQSHANACPLPTAHCPLPAAHQHRDSGTPKALNILDPAEKKRSFVATRVAEIQFWAFHEGRVPSFNK
jgi:hypothetical protein